MTTLTKQQIDDLTDKLRKKRDWEGDPILGYNEQIGNLEEFVALFREGYYQGDFTEITWQISKKALSTLKEVAGEDVYWEVIGHLDKGWEAAPTWEIERAGKAAREYYTHAVLGDYGPMDADDIRKIEDKCDFFEDILSKRGNKMRKQRIYQPDEEEYEQIAKTIEGQNTPIWITYDAYGAVLEFELPIDEEITIGGGYEVTEDDEWTVERLNREDSQYIPAPATIEDVKIFFNR